MNASTARQLDTYLERVLRRTGKIRRLNLSAESDLHQALEETQCLLAVLAMYRHTLKHTLPGHEPVVKVPSRKEAAIAQEGQTGRPGGSVPAAHGS